MRSEPSRDLFLGHCSSSPLISHRVVHLFPPPSPFSLPPKLLISKKPPPKHHSTTTAPPLRRHSTSASRPIIPISSFSSFSHLNPIIPKLLHFRLFFIIQGHNFTTDCAHLIAVLILQGGGVDFRRVLKPVVFGVHTSCSTKSPNEPTACLEGKVQLLGPLGPKP
jgi:hypothetical protein